MNRWILRGLVTAGFAGAAWAISSAAASAGTTTEPAVPTSVVTINANLDRTGLSARIGLDTGRRDNSGSHGGATGGGSAGLAVDVTVTRPAQRRPAPAGAEVVVTAGVATAPAPTAGATAAVAIVPDGQSTSDGAASAGVDVTVGQPAPDGDTSADVEGGIVVRPLSVGAAVVLGAYPTESDTGTGSGAGSEDPDTDAGADPGADPGAATSAGSGSVAVSATGTSSARPTTTVTGGAPSFLARTGAGTAGLALVTLLLLVAGAAVHRVGSRR